MEISEPDVSLFVIPLGVGILLMGIVSIRSESTRREFCTLIKCMFVCWVIGLFTSGILGALLLAMTRAFKWFST